MASGEDPTETLRRIHPEHCGTPNGYQQISRARRAAAAAGLPLPEYDEACKTAWANYYQKRRAAGGRLNLPRGPRPAAEAKHGTVQRWRQHIRERDALRRAGVPEEELPEIDEACRKAWKSYNDGLAKLRRARRDARRAQGERPDNRQQSEALRRRVLRKVDKIRQAKA